MSTNAVSFVGESFEPGKACAQATLAYNAWLEAHPHAEIRFVCADAHGAGSGVGFLHPCAYMILVTYEELSQAQLVARQVLGAAEVPLATPLIAN